LLALFLNRLFATDGWATVLTTGQAQLGYASVSERLARQIQHLLLRFGVIASLRRRLVAYDGARRPAWQIDVTDARSIQTFVEQIGIFGKESALARVGEALATRRYQTNRDLVPAEIWSQISLAKGDISWRAVASRLGFGPGHNLHVGTQSLSRDRLRRFADVLKSESLRIAADSDVYWDRIVSIEYAGEKQVYDLTIPDTHNFVANDICVHNTAIAMNMIEHISADNRLPAAVFSLEMSKQQLAQRMLCSRGQIDAHKLRKGLLQSHEYAHLANVVGELAKAPIWVDDSPGLTILDLRAKARRLKLQHDIKCVLIDYMQLMDNPGPESRQQQISEISRGIKAVARELNVPVICLSQLNRASEGRDGHRPRMSDLRESGSIEQDADVIALLHREDYYRMSEPDFQPDNIAEIIIAKQRNGPTGTVKLTFVNKTTRFENLSTQSDPF
jgi:replicative DNA helicase